jgi:hypothetical protein
MKNNDNLIEKFCLEKNNWLFLWREGLSIYYFIINLMYIIMLYIEFKK